MSKEPSAAILLVNGTGAESRDVEGVVADAPRLSFRPTSMEQMKAELEKSPGDLVIFNVQSLGEAEVEKLTELRVLAKDIPLIVASPQLNPAEMRRLFTFQIHDWLCKPLNENELLQSIRSAIRATKTTNNRVHAVVSAVGGAGATTLAVSMLDLAFPKMLGRNSSVALFDLDFSTGNCSYVLNDVNEFNLASVASTPRRIDSEFIQVIQKKHERGFFIYSFKRPELNTEVNGYELVLRMLDAVSVEHDHTFLDIPYYATEWRDDVLSAVNTCTLVTELNLPAIKHTLDIIENIKDLRGDELKVNVVFNKWNPSIFGQRIGRRKLKELFGDIPMHYLPNDTALIGEAMDRGVLPSQINRSSRLLKRLRKYMKSIDLVEEAS